MAITLGTFTRQDNSSFTGTLKTLNFTAGLSIVPVEKMSENASPSGLCGPRTEVDAGWSHVAKTSRETYLINLKIAAPEFGPDWVRFRLVKLKHPDEDGATHITLWETARPVRSSPRRGQPRRGSRSYRRLPGSHRRGPSCCRSIVPVPLTGDFSAEGSGLESRPRANAILWSWRHTDSSHRDWPH